MKFRIVHYKTGKVRKPLTKYLLEMTPETPTDIAFLGKEKPSHIRMHGAMRTLAIERLETGEPCGWREALMASMKSITFMGADTPELSANDILRDDFRAVRDMFLHDSIERKIPPAPEGYRTATEQESRLLFLLLISLNKDGMGIDREKLAMFQRLVRQDNIDLMFSLIDGAEGRV